MEKNDSLYLSIQLYPSENHTGYNAAIRILKDTEKDQSEEFGIFYISYDHDFPKFIWEKCYLSATTKEYLELLAQMHVEQTIESEAKKSAQVPIPENTRPNPEEEPKHK